MKAKGESMNTRAPAHAAFHPDYLRRLCDALRDDGADVDRALAYAGLDWRQLEDANGPMSFEAARWLILASVDALPRPSLALELGRTVRLDDHGPVGRLAACSPTLTRAFAVLQRFGSLRVGALRLSVRRQGQAAELILDEAIALGDVRRFVLEHAAASLVSLVRELTGRDARELVLHMPFEAPPWRSAYGELAGRVHFGASRLVLQIPRAWLGQPRHGADHRSWRRAWADCDQAHRRQRDAVADRVRTLLALPGGLATSLDQVAAHLGLARRTLNRRLQDEGTSFSALIDAARQREALRLLRDPRVPVNEIAFRMGYVDSSNFGRCFRRWFGSTPSAVRNGKVPWPMLDEVAQSAATWDST